MIFTAIGEAVVALFLLALLYHLVLLIPFLFNFFPLQWKRFIVKRYVKGDYVESSDTTYYRFNFLRFYYLGLYAEKDGEFTEVQRGFSPHFIWQD